jgi:hypothetical protein
VAWVDGGPLDVLVTKPSMDMVYWTHGSVIAIKDPNSILDYLDDPIHHEVAEVVFSPLSSGWRSSMCTVFRVTTV